MIVIHGVAGSNPVGRPIFEVGRARKIDKPPLSRKGGLPDALPPAYHSVAMAAVLFALKKAVTFFLMPLQAGLLMLVTGLVLRWRGRQRSGTVLLTLGTLLLVVLSHRQVGRVLLAPLESQYPAVPEYAVGYDLPPELAACRYIVVLGGGHTDTGRLPALSQLSLNARSRLAEGVRLAHLLPDAILVTSGPGLAGQPTHAEILALGARSLGVDSARILTIDQGRDTEGEAAAIRGLIGDAPFALVTSAWHMPRSMALMRGTGLQPLACPADFRAIACDQFILSDWFWGLDGLEDSTWAIRERLGLLWARLRGRAG